MLPTEKTKKSNDLRDYPILIYGPSGIGKTTFASQFPNALLLDCDNAATGVESYRIKITSWEDAVKTSSEVLLGQHQFKSLILDSFDSLYRHCSRAFCQERKIEDISMCKKHGEGYSIVGLRCMNLLESLRSKYHVILTSHVKMQKDDAGNVTRYLPSMTEKIHSALEAWVGITLFCDYQRSVINGEQREERVLRTNGGVLFSAKDRSRRLPSVLPLSTKAFLEAWEKGQEPVK